MRNAISRKGDAWISDQDVPQRISESVVFVAYHKGSGGGWAGPAEFKGDFGSFDFDFVDAHYFLWCCGGGFKVVVVCGGDAVQDEGDGNGGWLGSIQGLLSLVAYS
jgi:hypothetical protein